MDNDKANLLIISIIMFLLLIFGSVLMINYGHHTDKDVAKYGCGEFDKKTGEFKVKENKK